MYIPSHFNESRVEAMHALIRSYPLGTLVAATNQGLEANHVPFVIDELPAPYGMLRCHVARANPVWRSLADVGDVLVVFQGPDAYVSPSVYEAKQKDGKVVPTWNYVAVHAYGQARAIDDVAWLSKLLDDLTHAQESDRPAPWRVSDAPRDYTEKLMRAIVGIEIPIAKLLGKWKVSQNRSSTDRERIAADLKQRAVDHAEMIEQLEKAR
jgi:transcriptional regulator